MLNRPAEKFSAPRGNSDAHIASGRQNVTPPGMRHPPAMWRGLGLGLLCALIWGIQPVILRRSAIDGLTAADVAVLRFLVSSLLLVPVILGLRPIPVGALGWRRALALTCLSGSPFSLALIGGIAFAPGFHNAVITNGMIPVVAMILAILVLGQRPGPGRLGGITLVVAGIGVFFWQSTADIPGRDGAWRGDMLFLVSSIMWATFGLLAGRWRVEALKTTASISLLSLGTMPILALLLPMRLAQAGISAVVLQALYQGVLVGVVANFLYMRVVMLLGAVAATLFLPLIPVVATSAGAVLLGEWPSAWELAGILLVVAGMAIAMTSRDA